MSFRKSVLLARSASLLMMVGLAIVAGLVIGVMALDRATDRPEHLPIGSPAWTLVSPVAYVTLAPTMASLAPATPTPSLTSSPTSTPAPPQTPLPPANMLSPSPATASVPGGAPADAPIPTDTTTPSLTDTPTPADTHTSPPTPTDTPTSTPSLSPTDTPTPTPSPLPPGRITGRVLLDGTPASEGVTLKLEDQTYNVIAETTVGADGVYAFADLEASSGGYNVLFAQEWNTQYGIDQVVSWGWMGPVTVEDGAVVELPDFELSLSGFGQINPEPDATFSTAALSSQTPVVFEWAAYPQAVAYWVDLARGEESEVVWQSTLIQDTSVAFDGTLDGGTHIQPGEYWWGVGARRALGSYTLTVYGYQQRLSVEP